MYLVFILFHLSSGPIPNQWNKGRKGSRKALTVASWWRPVLHLKQESEQYTPQNYLVYNQHLLSEILSMDKISLEFTSNSVS